MDPVEDLPVLAKMSAGQIARLAGMFESGRASSAAKIREIVGECFSDKEICKIERVFRSFAPPGKDGPVRDPEEYDSEAQSRDLLAAWGLKRRDGPPPTIRGMLAKYESDLNSAELIREIRDG